MATLAATARLFQCWRVARLPMLVGSDMCEIFWLHFEYYFCPFVFGGHCAGSDSGVCVIGYGIGIAA